MGDGLGAEHATQSWNQLIHTVSPIHAKHHHGRITSGWSENTLNWNTHSSEETQL